MPVVLAFSLLLVVGVVLSGRAERGVLSTTVLFLGGGLLLGRTGIGLLSEPGTGELMEQIAEIALFAVLLTDGLHLPLRDLRSGWRLPGRALAIGLPVTLVIATVAGHLLLGLEWMPALLLGAVLAPTDPVLAEAIVGRTSIPRPVRHTLNVESGLNDGLVLPLVVVLLTAMAPAAAGAGWWPTLAGSLGGVALGIGVAWAVTRLERVPALGMSQRYRPLLVITVGLVVFTLTETLGANPFLGAFAASITMASVAPEVADEFGEIGAVATELLKLGAVFLLGLALTRALLTPTLGLVAFVALILAVARPVGVGVALLGSPLRRAERLAIAWFGPKGFASVTFSLLVLHRGVAGGDEIVHAAAAVIVASMVLHSSTDVVVARQLAELEDHDAAGDAIGDVALDLGTAPSAAGDRERDPARHRAADHDG